jgi:C1A family cysteine protease
MRRAIFAANAAKVAAHNAKGESWTMELNKFADLTSTEFKARFASSYRPAATKKAAVKAAPKNVSAPASVDWTTKGAVTPVKNQGQCGSCWAFSTTGSLEGATFLATGTLPSLSEQQLVDCSGSAGNQGCNGGLMDSAFTWIESNGICSEASYPYTAVDGTCKTTCTPVAGVKSFTDVTVNSESALEDAVAQQPVSVAVEADQSSFQLYAGGVMTAACGTALDHGVLAVGYGTDSTGVQYWKVKNSWGADWGMNGYILLGKSGSYNGGAGQCGIYMDPSWPTYGAPPAAKKTMKVNKH